MANFEVVFAGIELLTYPHVNLVNCTGNYTPQRCGGQLFKHHPYLWHLKDQADFKGQWQKKINGPICGVPLDGLDLYFEAPNGQRGGPSDYADIPSTQDFDQGFSHLIDDRTPGSGKPVITRVRLIGEVGSLASALVGTNSTGVETQWTSSKSGYPARVLAEALVWQGQADHLELKLNDDKYIKFSSQNGEPVRLAITNLPNGAGRRPTKSKSELHHFKMYYELFKEQAEDCGYPKAVGQPSYLRPLNIPGWLAQNDVLGPSIASKYLQYGAHKFDGDASLCPPSKFP